MIVVVIPAKGQSNRLANKNMIVINGRPMLDYVIDQANASGRADTVYVSTDSDDIAAHAKSRGVPVIRRPESLGGEVPIIEVYKHALQHMPDGEKVTVVIGLQPDHPDRNVSVDEALGHFERAGADVLNSVDGVGATNGAHYILSRHFIDTGEARKPVTIVDDCTNIHFPEDLERAARELAARAKP